MLLELNKLLDFWNFLFGQVTPFLSFKMNSSNIHFSFITYTIGVLHDDLDASNTFPGAQVMLIASPPCS